MKNKLSFPQSKLSTKRSSRKKLYLIIISVIILGAAIGFWWYSNAQQKDNVSENKGREMNKSKNKKDSSTKNNSSKDKNTPSSPQPGLPGNSTSTPPSQVPPAANLSVTINDFAQANRMVQANAVIEGSPGRGTCVFTFSTPDAKPVVRQLASAGSDGPQTCSVSISEVEFTKTGAWRLNVTFYVNNSRSEANRDVTIT